MREPHRSPTLLWVLGTLFCIAWFAALGMRALVPTDEGRYAEMGREMLASGDWITLRLNGIKYFYKPPLQTWMNAASFLVFGLGEWQARLWTGLCGLFGVGLVAYTGRTLFSPRAGFFAALVLASSFWWAALGHINTLDMGLSGMMTLALCALLLAQRDGAGPAQRRNWMLACWAGMALAVLSKGLIGLALPGAVLVLYTLLSRDWAIWGRLHLGKGLLLFFAITAPWFVLVALKNPEHPHFFFIHEHVDRFLTKVHNRTGPWYYFLPMLLVGFVPWLGLLPQTLAHGLRRTGKGADDGKDGNAGAPEIFRPKLMLLIWFGFILFFFSYSSSKLPSYILPVFPALALLAASFLDSAEGARPRHLMGAAILLALMAAFGLAMLPQVPQMAFTPLEAGLLRGYQPWIAAACGIALAASAAALLFLRKGMSEIAVLCIALGGFGADLLLLRGSDAHGSYRAGLPLLPAFQAELTPETKLYAVGMYDQTLPFYLRRTMTMVEHMDELEFGLKQEPHLWLPTRAAFTEEWVAQAQAGRHAIAVTRPHIYTSLKRAGLPMRVLASDTRRVVISNRVEGKPDGKQGGPADGPANRIPAGGKEQ